MTSPDHVVGLAGKSRSRADFDEREFAGLVERSSRFVWERASPCPCSSVNGQTRQSNPTCARCRGAGVFWYGVPDYVPDETVTGPLSLTQRALLRRNDGVIVRGFIKSATYTETPNDTIGRWFWGATRISVRPENRVGYYDRFFALDSEISITQVIDMPAGLALTPRFPIIEALSLFSDTDRFAPGQDFTVEGGVLTFDPASVPDPGTVLSLRYLTFPAWLVTNYPHVVRATSVKKKKSIQAPQDLVLEAEIKLEYEIE